MKNSKEITEGILFIDYYQLTMAQLYFQADIHSKKVQFDYFFRNYPDYGDTRRVTVSMPVFMVYKLDEGGVIYTRFYSVLAEQQSNTGESVFKPDFLTI